jgi:uncharacterized protein
VTEFTPVSSTLGGIFIGLAAAILLLGSGRVAGISGILGQAIWPGSGEERGWRIAFLLSLPAGAALVALVNGPLVTQIDASPLVIVCAGVLVGFGTRLGNGCTSGHGVCGMSRGSSRSIAATLVFMAIGGVVVFLTRHLVGAFA